MIFLIIIKKIIFLKKIKPKPFFLIIKPNSFSLMIKLKSLESFFCKYERLTTYLLEKGFERWEV